MPERTHDGRAFRLLTILDESTRECLDIEVTRQMNHQDVWDRLAELFVHRGVPECIRSDNGSEFTAQAVRVYPVSESGTDRDRGLRET